VEKERKKDRLEFSSLVWSDVKMAAKRQTEKETPAEIQRFGMPGCMRWRGYLLKFICWVWRAEKQRVRS
jgi:hypothetical protein